MFNLSTPAFLVDAAVVRRNCDRMREKAQQSNVAFRPHVKTHKTLEIGRLQHGGTAGPITVSTLAEAEFFAGGGFDDITYAMPVAPEKLERAAGLAKKIRRLNLLLDSTEALRAIEASGFTFDALLKVDCGYHRAGVDPDAAASVQLAEAMASSPALRFHGLLTHAGHSYDVHEPVEIAAIAREETSALTRLRNATGRPLLRSIGSTPTASIVERFENCEEVRPGNYVFYDAFQAAIGSCKPDDVAVSVLATVVGCYPERGGLVVDAGALALSKDAGPTQLEPRIRYGIVCDLALRPQPLELVALSQEHGRMTGDVARYPVGTRLRIIPNHSCLTAAMFDRYHVVDEGRAIAEWHPVRGW